MFTLSTNFVYCKFLLFPGVKYESSNAVSGMLITLASTGIFCYHSQFQCSLIQRMLKYWSWISQLHKINNDKDSSADDNNYYYLKKIKSTQQTTFLNFSAEWFLASLCYCVIRLNYSSGSSFAILNSETRVRTSIKHRAWS